jgi:hypothetical protein
VIFFVSIIVQTASSGLALLLITRVVSGKCQVLLPNCIYMHCRNDCGCFFCDRSCLFIRNSNKRTSRTNCIVSTIGYHYWYWDQFLDRLW